MCGRYGADEKVNTWIASRCQTSSDNILRVGDIRPGERTSAIIMGRSKPLVAPMTWGIQGKSGLIINARKETIWEKPSFRHLIQNRRCLLPASCFYEWDSEKHKATLSGKDDETLFLAGVYQAEPEGGRFVIITAPADETVRPIHDRMPVRIPESLISAWLSDADSAKELLDSATVPLRREQAVEQMSLWEE